MPENPASSNQAPAGRRWLPAVSFGLIVLGSLLALTWQTIRWFDLRRENAGLQSASAQLTRLREDQAEAQRLRAAAANAKRREGEQEELEKLRAEAAQLRAATNELQALRAEAQRLEDQRAQEAARAGVTAEEDPFARAKERAQRINCVSNLKQIALAARIWANDHKDTIPPDFLSMTNELNRPGILTCPGDTARSRAATWREFDGGSVSYEFLSPGVEERLGPQVVLFRCPLHHNVALLDGSVQQLSPVQRVEKVDGLFKIVRVQPPTEP